MRPAAANQTLTAVNHRALLLPMPSYHMACFPKASLVEVQSMK